MIIFGEIPDFFSHRFLFLWFPAKWRKFALTTRFCINLGRGETSNLFTTITRAVGGKMKVPHHFCPFCRFKKDLHRRVPTTNPKGHGRFVPKKTCSKPRCWGQLKNMRLIQVRHNEEIVVMHLIQDKNQPSDPDKRADSVIGDKQLRRVWRKHSGSPPEASIWYDLMAQFRVQHHVYWSFWFGLGIIILKSESITIFQANSWHD